jgi:foldase protein PrsA
MLSVTRRIAVFVPLVLCASLAGCGSNSSTPRPRGTAAAPPVVSGHSKALITAALATPVATVGGVPITRARVQHWMAIDDPAKREVPEPPSYSACIAHLRATAAQVAGTTTSVATAQLKRACQRRYTEMLQPALSSLIHAQWLMGESAADGLKANAALVARELAASERANGFQATLATSGQTVADLKFSLMLTQLSDQIYERVAHATPRITRARVARYYDEHEDRYAIPQERDLRIIRTTSAAAAAKVRAEVQSGKSFGSVLKHIALPQPIGTNAGVLLGLAPNQFSEPVLNDAIFKARPHAIVGPVKISLGYYVFEVTRVIPAHQEPLARVEATIRQKLPEELHRRALASFVTAFRRKWTARTTCRPGYVAQDCRQFVPSKTTPPRDPYTF